MVAPFRTRPTFLTKIWGGRKLETHFGKPLPGPGPYGESWEVADLPEGQCVVDSGAFRGRGLSELVDELGPALVGTAAPGGRFPLLVKLLDAAADLSVQVHPGPSDLAALPGASSKDECWIILHADDEARILLGVQPGTDAAGFRAAVEAGNLEPVLRAHPVAAGDFFRVAPGTVHAICSGVALLEIQQPSDTTYRVYDYGRPGLDGNPRPLHLDKALAVMRYGVAAAGTESPGGRPGVGVLVDVPAYRVESIRASGAFSWAVDPRSAQIVHVLDGKLLCGDVTVGAAQTLVVPAASGRVDCTFEPGTHAVAAALGGAPVLAEPA